MMENPRPEETRLPIRTVGSRRPAREAQAAASSNPRRRSVAPRTDYHRVTVEDYPEENDYAHTSHNYSNSSTHSRSRYVATPAASEWSTPRPLRRKHRNSGSKAEKLGKGANFEPSSDEGEDIKPRRRSHHGHRFHDIINQGHARTQHGDMYIENQTVYNSWEQASSEGKDDKRLDILEALELDHMDTRLLGVAAAYGQTCRWLFDTDEYVGWRNSSETDSRQRFLWIKGKPGAGKSTLMKLAFEEASEHFPRSIVASFFFNARGHGAAKTIEGMYRSLLHQILTKLPRLPSRLPTHIGKSVIRDGWPVPILQNLLQEAVLALREGETLVFYIDALDECDEDEIRLALRYFEQLMAQSLLRNLDFLVCFASRHYPNISVLNHRPMNIDSQAAHLDDICQYAQSALKVTGSLGDQLRKSINDRCSGVFLWAVLTVGILNKSYDGGATRSQLHARLREIPNSIQALFTDILQEHDDFLIPTLQWMLFSQRALEIQELYFAIMVSVGKISTGSWDRTEIDVSRMESFILRSSRGLIEFKRRFPQFIHESVREYLLGGGLTQLDPTLGGHVASGSHAKLAQWCQAYVALDTAYHCETQGGSDEDIFYKSELALHPKHIKPFRRLPFLNYALSATTYHMQISFDKGLLPFTALGLFADLWLNLALHRYSGAAHYECAALLCLLLARKCGCLEPATLGCSSPTQTTFTDARHKSLHTESSTHRYQYHVVRKPSIILRNAANFASIDIARFFRDRRHVKNFQTTVEGALFLSAGLGLNRVLEMLIDYAAWMKETARTLALSPATLSLQKSTVKELLKVNANPDGIPAAYLLLEHSRSLNANSTLLDLLAIADDPLDYEGDADETRLEIAVELLDGRATSYYALMGACMSGRTELARLLIDKKAPVNLERPTRTDSSALQIARERGYDDIVRMLIEAGATEPTNDCVSSDDSTVAQCG